MRQNFSEKIEMRNDFICSKFHRWWYYTTWSSQSTDYIQHTILSHNVVNVEIFWNSWIRLWQYFVVSIQNMSENIVNLYKCGCEITLIMKGADLVWSIYWFWIIQIYFFRSHLKAIKKKLKPTSCEKDILILISLNDYENKFKHFFTTLSDVKVIQLALEMEKIIKWNFQKRIVLIFLDSWKFKMIRKIHRWFFLIL